MFNNYISYIPLRSPSLMLKHRKNGDTHRVLPKAVDPRFLSFGPAFNGKKHVRNIIIKID